MQANQSLWWVALMGLLAQGAAMAAPVLTCAQVTSAAPSSGATYQGLVVNDDYHLRVRVPKGLTGWGAAVFPDGTGAPFHGFAVYPADDRRGCIVVTIGWRVDEDDAPKRPQGAPSVMIPGATAWMEEASGVAEGQSLFNRTVTFSAAVGHSFADGSIQIIGPSAERRRLTAIGDAIVRSMAIGP